MEIWTGSHGDTCVLSAWKIPRGVQPRKYWSRRHHSISFLELLEPGVPCGVQPRQILRVHRSFHQLLGAPLQDPAAGWGVHAMLYTGGLDLGDR